MGSRLPRPARTLTRSTATPLRRHARRLPPRACARCPCPRLHLAIVRSISVYLTSFNLLIVLVPLSVHSSRFAPPRLDGLPTPPNSPQRPRGPVVHPVLVARAQPSFYFDVTRPPTDLRLTPQELNEPASHPPSSHITLVIPGLIWNIEVSSPRTVTVNDIIRALYEKLQRPASNEEYSQHTPPVQQIASLAFAARKKMPGEGVKRFDFLGPKTRFAGLSRSQDGTDRWVVHFY